MYENHFYATSLSSPLERLFDEYTEDDINYSGVDNDQYQVQLGDDLIFEDPFLSYMHENLNKLSRDKSVKVAYLGLSLLPPSNMYQWHRDAHQCCNLNYIDCVKDKYTLFRAEKGEHEYFNKQPPIDTVRELRPFIKISQEPRKWTALNSQNIHAGINFDSKPKFLLQYSIKLRTGIVYAEVIDMIKAYESQS